MKKAREILTGTGYTCNKEQEYPLLTERERSPSVQSCGHTSSKGDKKLLVSCITITFGKFFEPGITGFMAE